MSGSSPSPSTAKRPPEDHRPNREAARPSSFAAVPGWMISGMLHAGVIVFLITSGIPSCGDGQIGTGADTGEFREVGIYIKEAVPSPEQPNDSEEEDSSEKPQSPDASPAVTPATQTADTVSNLIDVPDVPSRAVIGESRGAPATGGIQTPSEALVQANRMRSPASAGQGPGKVSFMGQTTEAQTIVYAIDTSSSMSAHEAIAYAKVRLMQSINGLGQDQHFQIIAYTNAPTLMRLKNDRAESIPLYRATRPNLALATQYINSLGANGGTKHYPALREAFRYKPDVIFFLTDAEGGLTPKELSEIKTQWNKQGKTHIHCIQFGEGPDLKTSGSMFFRQLASQNRGSYTYIDVQKLESP